MRTICLLVFAAAALFAESASGIKWTPPAAWKTQPQRPMRAATYVVPAAPGDKEPGECAVFYFGPGQGGGVQANLDRWQAQFPEKEGSANTAKSTISGFTVTSIDLSGTYAWSPSPMSTEKVNKPGYRMLGAIVEAPQGAVFFKLTAPSKTATVNASAFRSMIQSIVKE